MEPKPIDFHSEEYKQIRSEVVGVVEKVDQYFKYIIAVPTGVYSWLIATSIGTQASPWPPTHGVLCLKTPLVLSVFAWLIPPLFVAACGLVILAFRTRISQMGEYLTKLENELGSAHLGWEKFSKPLSPDLTKARKQTWNIVFWVCAFASFAGIACSVWVGVYCMAK